MSFIHHHAPEAQPARGDICLVVQADSLLVGADTTDAVILADFGALESWAPAVETAPLHVGVIDGRPCWLIAFNTGDIAAPEGWQWHDTRSLLSVLTSAQIHAISCARQLLWWDRRHQFCGACGAPTVPMPEERARRCPNCSAVFFPVVSPAVIVAVTRGDELLLAHNRHFRSGMFSLLAGFVDPGESLEQAIVREVREEVGIEIDRLNYVTSQPWSFPNSLMIGFTARYVGGEVMADGREIEQAGWYKRTGLPDVPRKGTVARNLIDRWLSA